MGGALKSGTAVTGPGFGTARKPPVGLGIAESAREWGYRCGGRERLPRWMRISSMSELKHTLVAVIGVYLVVDFATDVAQASASLTSEANFHHPERGRCGFYR